MSTQPSISRRSSAAANDLAKSRMDPLGKKLTESGAVDVAMVHFAEAHAARERVPLDTALLELDLIDEDDLLRALAEHHGRPPAAFDVLDRVRPEVGEKLPLGFSQTFRMCPVALEGSRLAALVAAPLAAESVQELRDLFGLEPRQFVAPAHYIELARSRVYGEEPPSRTRRLELRLARRRKADDVRTVIERLAQAPSFATAAGDVLSFALTRLEFACLLSARDDGLKVVANLASKPELGALLPTPAVSCSVHAAIAHGGYFFGPLLGNQADEELFESLDRSVPRWAFVAPVTTSRGTAAVLLAENGERGIAQRWGAEIALLLARLAQRASRQLHPSGDDQPQERVAAPTESDDPEVVRLDAENRVLERLRRAAAADDLPLEDFVEKLLLAHATQPDVPVERQPEPAKEKPSPADEATNALVGEVRGLFEKLATDIPADLVPRIAASAPTAQPPAAPAPPAPSPAAAVGLEIKAPSGPREVADYRSKRRKAARVKM
jgi:hypothetical protein